MHDVSLHLLFTVPSPLLIDSFTKLCLSKKKQSGDIPNKTKLVSSVRRCNLLQ